MLRRSFTGSPPSTRLPSISTSPDVGSTMRLIMRSRVVLPQPDEPTKTVVLRDGSTRLKSFTARVPSGNRLVTLRNSIKAVSSRELRCDLDAGREGDVAGEVLADAVERGRIRVRIRPGEVFVQFSARLHGVVLANALPRAGVGRRALDEGAVDDGCRWEVPVAFDADEIALVGLGDDGSCEYSLHGPASSDVVPAYKTCRTSSRGGVGRP